MIANVLLGQSARPVFQAQEDVVYIFSPAPGQALQGIVPVEVSLIVPQLEVASLEFRYSNHPTNTWFLIAQVTESIPDGVIAQWDTTMITDGEYDLRLLAQTRDQRQVEYQVLGLRVRNYSLIETETPTPAVAIEMLGNGKASSTPTPTTTLLPPTSTPLPTNPAILTREQFSETVVVGSLIPAGLFLLLGMYLVLRTRFSGRN